MNTNQANVAGAADCRVRGGFTLIELLVVISIIGVLAAIALPVFNTVRRKSQQVTSMSNLKQWGGAMLSSASDNNNTLPWEGQAVNVSDDTAWYNQLPPYMGEKPYKTRRSTELPQAGQKSVFVNPAVPISVNALYKPYLFCYAMNYYLSSSSTTNDPSNGKIKTMPLSMLEHPAACVFMAEKSDDFANCNPSKIKAYFGNGDPATGLDNGANFLFCDGHVQLLVRRDFDPTYNPKVLQGGSGSAADVLPDTSFTFIPFQGAAQ